MSAYFNIAHAHGARPIAGRGAALRQTEPPGHPRPANDNAPVWIVGEEENTLPVGDDLKGFTGHIRDSATSLNYMQARNYDPVMGRFLSIDPKGFEDTGTPAMFGRYTYVGNDPVNATDPSGEAAFTLGVDVEGSVAGAGIGVQAKLAVSVSRVPGTMFGCRVQKGFVGSINTTVANGVYHDSSQSLGSKVGAFLGTLVMDTGASAMVEGGVFKGTDANPADVSDLGGDFTQVGATVGKKMLTNALGKAGKIVNYAPAPELSGEAVFGENGIKGFEVGGGVAVGNPALSKDIGTTSDVGTSKAVVIEDKFVGIK